MRDHKGTVTAGYQFDPLWTQATFTQAYGITPSGSITGIYNGLDGGSHGFLRAKDGSFISFDAPGSTFTQPVAINPSGDITGTYRDSQNFSHGFLRTP